MAVYSDLSIDQGTDFTAEVQIDDTDGTTANLTGYTVAGQIRKSYDSTTYTAFSASVSNATGGTVSIALTAAQTNALASGRYVYDVEITDASGVVTRMIQGRATVSPGITS